MYNIVDLTPVSYRAGVFLYGGTHGQDFFDNEYTTPPTAHERHGNSNGSRVKKIIEMENYYNLINGYKGLFLDKSYTGSDEAYLPGTKFDEVYALYLFDRELRNIFIRYILEIETM